MARLEKWSLVGLTESKPVAIRGEIHGDERFSDGTPITSSRLHHLDPDGHFACTKNHTYELGTISDAFARWMAANGRSLATFAVAVDPAEGRNVKRATVTPIGTRPATGVATSIATSLSPSIATSIATAVVQAPTAIVAAR